MTPWLTTNTAMTSETQLHGNDAPATIEAIEALASRALSQAQVAFDAARTQSNTMTNIQGKADEKVRNVAVLRSLLGRLEKFEVQSDRVTRSSGSHHHSESQEQLAPYYGGGAALSPRSVSRHELSRAILPTASRDPHALDDDFRESQLQDDVSELRLAVQRAIDTALHSASPAPPTEIARLVEAVATLETFARQLKVHRVAVQRRRRKVRSETADKLKTYIRSCRTGRLSKGKTPLRDYVQKQNEELLKAHRKFRAVPEAQLREEAKEDQEEKEQALREARSPSQFSHQTRKGLGRLFNFDGLSTEKHQGSPSAPHVNLEGQPRSPANISLDSIRSQRRHEPGGAMACIASHRPCSPSFLAHVSNYSATFYCSAYQHFKARILIKARPVRPQTILARSPRWRMQLEY
eukprot:INCI7168.4.p1 GENE.INCI7168.4~~INCI7168.4.p1  ORF type:complete len:408 (+),score=55.50 INCI7168.4:440-1663(+)